MAAESASAEVPGGVLAAASRAADFRRLRAHRAEGAKAGLNRLRNAAARRSWDRIAAPTLLIWGEKDRALGKELTEEMEGLFSGTFELVYLPDCAHWVQQECPQEVNRIMLGFLQRNPPGGAPSS